MLRCYAAPLRMGPGDILGAYIIEAPIAEGGMGVVYKAKNRVTGQDRALKVVREELVKNREFVERFVREATIASAVRHPNLVETLEPGIEGNTIYLPMELLIGETLASRLRRVKRMSAHETATILAPVCEAVQLLHDQNLVHRDLKPANLFLANVNGREVPKVIDLGTARDQDDAEHTMTGMVVGSPYYMAPEQAEGRRDVDGRADQYALGVVAYQMVTGARPYESDDTRSALAKLMRGDPYTPPSRVFGGVPPMVEAAIVRSLSREREQRFLRIVDFGRALAMAASGMDAAHTVADLGDAVEAAKAIVAARPLLTVSGNAETQIRDVEQNAPSPAAPAPLMAPPSGSGFAAPPPSTASAPASGGGGRGLVVVFGVLALFAIGGAVGLWFFFQHQAAQMQPHAVELGPVPTIVPPTTIALPPTTVVTIAPATGVPATGVPATGVPATGVPATGVPATGVPATTVVPPTTIAAPPPTTVAHPPPTTTVAPPPTTTVAHPPPTTTVAHPPPTTTVAHPPPTTTVAPPPSSGPVRTPPPTSTVAHPPPTSVVRPPPSTTSGDGHRHRPPASTAPCGAATGIPCLD